MALLKIILLLFIGITVARKCKSPIELAVVVDASDSLSLKDVRHVKLFIKSIANFFRMAVFSSHVSVVLAGYNVSVAIALNKIGADKLKFYEAVDKVVKPLGGEWSVNRGLQMIKKRVFTEENEMRPFLPRIVLVVTSGKPGKGNDIQLQIKNLNDIGAKVYIVSVGDVARRDKIMRVIKNESSEIVKVHLNNFGELTSFASVIGEDICQKDYHDELTTCKAKMDVGFIVDSSGSINNAGYLSMKTFMKAISVYLGFAPDALRVGAVLYSKEAKLWIRFNKIVELRKLFKKLWKMPHYRDVTRIDLGLDVANTQLFTKKSGMRDDAIKIAILLTDGEQTTRGINDLIPLREAADKLREREVAVFAVGIGKSVRKDQLLEITNTSEYVKILSSFNDLKSVTRKVAKDVCQLVNDPPIVNFTRPIYTAIERKNVTVGVSIFNNKRKTPVTIRIIPKSDTAEINDFDDSIKEIKFKPKETGTKFVEITLINDKEDEATEEFTVSLSSNSTVVLGNSSKIQIIDDDVPRKPIIEFTRPVYKVLENKNCVTVGISVTNGNVTRPVSVRIFSTFGTASTDDTNRVDKEITFQPGEIGPKVVQINLVIDRRDKPTEEFTVSLASNSNVILGNSSKVQILNNDVPFEPIVTTATSVVHQERIELPSPPVIEFTRAVYKALEKENSVLVGIFVTNGNVTQSISVRIFSSFGTASKDDFVGIDKEITFQPGEIGPKVVQINLVNDRHDELTEEFTVSLASNSRVILGNSSKVKILDDDAPPVIEFTRPVYEVLESRNSVAVGISVTNGNVTRPVSVRIFSSFGTARKDDFVGINKEITFQPGEIGPKVVQINLVNDKHDEPTEEFTVSFASSSRVILGNSSKVKILDDDAPPVIEFTRPVYEVLESKNSVAIGISVTNGNVTRPVSVRIIPNSGTASNKDFIDVVKELKFQPGEFGPKFMKIGLVNDKEVEPEEEFYLSLSSSSNIARGNLSIVRIFDDDSHSLPVIKFTQSDYNALEDENAVVGISVAEGKIIQPLTVRIIPNTQSAGENDFENVPQEVTFQPGETGPKFVDIILINDANVEPIEEFTVSLTSNSSVILGNSSSVNIHDDDAVCRRMDIGFLLDSTASMRNCNFKKEKEFLKDIVSYFNISQDFTRVSTIQYGARNILTHKFNETKSLEDFQRQIDSLQLKGGSARLGEAMYLAASSMFTVKSGMRPHVPKILVVLSDGSEKVPTEFAKIIKSMLYKNKVRVIAVGIGEADLETLSQFVSSPKDLIMVDKFQDATENLVALLNRACISGSDSQKCRVTKKSLTNVKISGCVSRKPVEIGVCSGDCLSNFVENNGFYEMKCACCKVKESVTIPVDVQCYLDTRKTVKIRSAVSCTCASCTEKTINVH